MASTQESVPVDSTGSDGSSRRRLSESRLQKYLNVSIMDDVEFLEDYKPGGLCPVDIGDVLDGKFEVIHKLGHGGIATVWLCYEINTKTWRAVKVNAADKSSEDCSDMKAIKALNTLSVKRNCIDNSHVAMPIDIFWTTSPNGRHLCSVLPLLGPRLSGWRGELGKDTDRVNDICYQIAEGLSYIHGNGICHGDFRPQNILMRLEPIDRMEKEEMLELIGEPTTAEVWTQGGQRSENAPREVVKALPWQRFKKFVTNDIAIVDFGESFESSNPPEKLGIPWEYAAPEVIFDGKPSISSDIWSLACTLLEARLGSRLAGDLVSIIRRMERFISPVPYPFRPVAERMVYDQKLEEQARGELYPESELIPPQNLQSGEDGASEPMSGAIDVPINKAEERENEVSQYSHPLQKKLGSKQMVIEMQRPADAPPGAKGKKVLTFYTLPDEEVLLLADLLGKMFQYEPGKRIKAADVLKHEWYKKRQTMLVSVFISRFLGELHLGFLESQYLFLSL
ncbi:kinase-like protein [Biscogniauxia marginata]|nr:kinase-like protein [Biscogniauxia marginata]